MVYSEEDGNRASAEQRRRSIEDRDSQYSAYGQDWLATPHQLPGGATPKERIMAGDLEAVNNLFHSILYVGVV
jgi:hypothetical protein